MQLYRQVRPSDFDQMVGSKEAVAALHRLLTRPEGFPGVVGLFGPSGCGKTTLARIAAKKYLNASDFTITELNLSESRGIDTAREIQSQMEFLPPGGGKRVFILDEAHKATPDFWNAMLKPLEDLPKHCAFFICTSEPKGIKNPAIHTRLTSIEVVTVSKRDLLTLVIRTNKEQGLGVPRDALDLVVEAADGSPRKALVHLDAIRGVSDMDEIRTLLKDPTDVSAKTIDLCRSIVGRASWKEVAEILAALKDASEDPERIRRAVTGHAQAILLKGAKNNNAAKALEIFASTTTYNDGFPAITILAYQAVNS